MKKPAKPLAPIKPKDFIKEKLRYENSDVDLQHVINELNRQAKLYGATSDIDYTKIYINKYHDYYDYVSIQFTYELEVSKSPDRLKKELEVYDKKYQAYINKMKIYNSEMKKYNKFIADKELEKRKEQFEKLKKEFANEV